MYRRTLIAGAALLGLMAAQPAFAQTGEIRFGLIPSEDAEKLIADSQSFIKALEVALGMKIKPFVAIDYSAVVEALKSDKLEIAFLGPAAYILARDKVKAPVEPIARGVMEQTGKSSYRALIIAHPAQPIHNLGDLKGKTFALVDPASTSGNFVPRLALHKNGIDADKDFKSLYYSGTHQASLIAVKEGKVNAAGIADEVYDRAMSRGQLKKEDVRIVFASDPIPGSPFVVRTNLPKDLQDKLRKGMMSLSNIQFGKLGVVKAMDPATDKDYDSIRELIAFQDQQKKAAKK